VGLFRVTYAPLQRYAVYIYIDAGTFLLFAHVLSLFFKSILSRSCCSVAIPQTSHPPLSLPVSFLLPQYTVRVWTGVLRMLFFFLFSRWADAACKVNSRRKSTATDLPD
jgi:hypothetical protein